jgi:anthranilate phosphoribosyltransferase
MVAGRVKTIGEGVERAALAIDTGAAKLALEKLIALTKDAAP